MTLKTRIIPILLWDGVQAVKTKQFGRPARPVGSMMQHIEVLERRNIDELIILDINASLEGREPLYDAISEFTSKLYCPVTIGGGISKIDHISKLLKAGADKVAINSAWYSNNDGSFIKKAAEKYGSQCIIWSIDVLPNYAPLPKSSQKDFKKYIDAGEILLTSVEKEGMQTGYDYNLCKIFSDTFDVPIIANGGCGMPQHMLEAVQAGADAVAASSMFLFDDITPRDCAKYLNEHGVLCRV